MILVSNVQKGSKMFLHTPLEGCRSVIETNNKNNNENLFL